MEQKNSNGKNRGAPPGPITNLVIAQLDALESGLSGLIEDIRGIMKYQAVLDELRGIKIAPPAKPAVTGPKPAPATRPEQIPERHSADSRPVPPEKNRPVRLASPEPGSKEAYILAGQLLYQRMNEQTVAVADLARNAGMSATTLRKVFQGDMTVRRNYYQKAGIELRCCRRIQELLPLEET